MSQDSETLKPFPIGRWLQWLGGLSLIYLVYIIAQSNPYISAWDEENSSFYQNVSQALNMFGLRPTAPTAIIFWDKEIKDNYPAIRAFRDAPSNLRVYGIHRTNTRDSVEIRKAWMKNAPRSASLLIDRSQLLETSFRIRSLPMVFIILPKQKKIYSFLGNIKDSKKRFLEIVHSE